MARVIMSDIAGGSSKKKKNQAKAQATPAKTEQKKAVQTVPEAPPQIFEAPDLEESAPVSVSATEYVLEKKKRGGTYSITDYVAEKMRKSEKNQKTVSDFNSWQENVRTFSQKVNNESAQRAGVFQPSESFHEYLGRTRFTLENLEKQGSFFQSYFTKYGGAYDAAYGKSTSKNLSGSIRENLSYLSKARKDLENEGEYWNSFSGETDYRIRMGIDTTESVKKEIDAINNEIKRLEKQQQATWQAEWAKGNREPEKVMQAAVNTRSELIQKRKELQEELGEIKAFENRTPQDAESAKKELDAINNEIKRLEKQQQETWQTEWAKGNREPEKVMQAATDALSKKIQRRKDLENTLYHLERRGKAADMEREAQGDPEFQRFAQEGKKRLEENYRLILRNRGDVSWYREYDAMTDEQKEIYNYYAGKEGDSAAQAYKKQLQEDINAKMAEDYLSRVQKGAEEDPVGYGVASLFTNPIASAHTAADMIANGAELITGPKSQYSHYADPNTPGQVMTRGTQLARQVGLEGIENPVLRGAGELGYTIADMIPSVALGAAGLPALGGAYMGIQEGTGSYADATSRGVSQGQALWYGVTSGVVSSLLEKSGIDNIAEAFAGGKRPATQILRGMLGSFLSEGSEEAAEDLANVVYDEIINGTKSSRNLAKNQYIAEGFSPEEAERKAWADIGADTFHSFIMGGLAGGIMSGAGYLGNAALAQVGDSQAQKQAMRADERYNAQLLQQAAQTVANGRRLSNSMAEEILNSPAAMELLESGTGPIITDDMTKSQQRAAVREAFENQQRMAESVQQMNSMLDEEGGGINTEALAGELPAEAAAYTAPEIVPRQTEALQQAPVTAENQLERTDAIRVRDRQAVAGFAETMQGAEQMTGRAALMGMYDDSQDAHGYIGEMMKVYKAGVDNKAVDAGGFTVLTPQQREAAYMAGQADGQRAARVDNLMKSFVDPASQGAGLVGDSYVRERVENEGEYSTYRRINRVAKLLGVRVRYAAEGELRSDANAGITGNEILLSQDMEKPLNFIMGHEITHWMQTQAPEQYRAFRELAEQDAVVKQDIPKKRKSYGEDALDEATADFAGRLLEDGRLMDDFIERHRTDKSLLEKVRDAIRNLINRLTGAEENQAQIAEEKLNAALEATAEKAASGETQASESGGERYSLKDAKNEFQFDIDEWDQEGRPEENRFILGSTGPVLQGLGAMEADIYMNGDKINTILNDHPEMSLGEIKRLPEILEDPVLILKSRNVGRGGRANTRLVLFGSLKAKNHQPVLCILDLRPIENGFVVNDMQKVSSAYTKSKDPVSFIRRSEILYADKKRTASLLRTIGFQTPIELQRSGSIGSISYRGQNVNIQGVPFSEVVIDAEDVKPRYSLKEDSKGENRYAGESLSADSTIYSYDFLTNLPDMTVTMLPEVSAVRGTDGRIDTSNVVSEGMKNARAVGTERDGKVFVRNNYTGKELRIDVSSIRHGLNGGFSRLLTNARLGAVIGDVVKNAVPINALHDKAAGVTGTYAMAAYTTDRRGREFVAIVTVEQHSGSIAGIEVYNVTHAVSGRQKRGQASDPHTRSREFTLSNLSKISIADFLEIVNTTHQSILPEDVLGRLGETRNPEGEYTDQVKFSLKGTETDSDAAAVMAENAALRKMVDYWKGQTKRTYQGTIQTEGVRKAARELMREFQVDMPFGDVVNALQSLYDYMANGEGKTHELSGEEVYARARQIAKKMVENAVAVDDNIYQQYKELRDYFRNTKLVISEADSQNIPGFQEFRKEHFGRLRISYGQTNIDVLYQELGELYPEFFDEETVSSPADQLTRIAEVADEIFAKEEYNPHSQDMQTAQEGLANELIERFFELPQAKTFADKQAEHLARRIYDVRQQNQEAVKKAVLKEREAAAKAMEKKERYYQKKVENGNARIMRGKIERSVNRLSTKLLKPSDKQHIPEGLRLPVAKLLEAINLEGKYTKDPKTGEWSKSPYGEPSQRTKAFKALKAQYEKIVQLQTGDMVIDPALLGDSAEGFPGLFEQVIEMEDIRLVDMSVQQLDIVWQTVRAVEHSITTAGKNLAFSKYETTSELAEAFHKDTGTRKAKQSLTKRHFALDLETPNTFFSHFGESGKAVFRMLRDAQDHQQIMTTEISETVSKIVKRQTVEKLEKEIHQFKTESGEKLKLSTAHIMELYELMKRKQAKEHLMKGGMVQPAIPSAKIRRGTDAVLLTLKDQQNIVSKLTAEEMRIADALQELCIGPLAQWGNEASMTAFGFKKFMGKDYWPIVVMREEVHSNAENSKDNARSIKNIGLAKSVVPHANNALDLHGVFETFSSHAADMINYTAWLCPMEDLNRLFNFKFKDEGGIPTGKTMKGLLDRVAGTGAQKYLENLMVDIQNGINAPSDSAFTGAVNKVIGNAKGAAVGANLRVIIQQPTAWFRALAVLPPQDLVRGLVKGKEGWKGWKKALKYSPTAQRKDAGGFDMGNSAQMKETLFDTTDKLRRVTNTLSAPAGTADAITWGRLWNACEWAVAREQKGLTKGSEAFYQAVNEKFTDMIDQTQVVDGVLQRSQTMRSNNALNKQATSFMGEPIMSLNLLMRAWDGVRYEQDTKKRGKAIRHLGRAATALLVTDVVNAFAQSLVDAIRDDDEDKKYWERFWAAFTGLDGDEESAWDAAMAAVLEGNVAGNMNPMGRIPYVKDLLSLVQGYKVTRMDADVLGDIVSAALTLTDSLSGSGKKTVKYAVTELAGQVGKMFGIPGKNLLRDIWGLARSIAVESGNIPLQYEMEKAIYNISNEGNTSRYLDILYRAYTSDNTADYDHIYSDLLKNGIPEDKIASGIENRMKKEQGVNSVSELENRYYTPEQQESYDRIKSGIEKNSIYKKATDEQREKMENSLHDLVIGNTAGEKIQAKIDGGAKYGLDETEYLLYRLALQMADKPTESGKTGTYTGDEIKDAIRMLAGLSSDEKTYLWVAQGKSSKNVPKW